MLAISRPYQKFEFYSIRDLPRLKSERTRIADYGSSYSARGFGFREVGDDDGYDDDRPSRYRFRWPRGWDLF
jgi:hypothetical protein